MYCKYILVISIVCQMQKKHTYMLKMLTSDTAVSNLLLFKGEANALLGPQKNVLKGRKDIFITFIKDFLNVHSSD